MESMYLVVSPFFLSYTTWKINLNMVDFQLNVLPIYHIIIFLITGTVCLRDYGNHWVEINRNKFNL